MKVLYQPHPYSQQRQREKARWIYPVHLAMEATYRRNHGDLVVWDCPDTGHYDQIITEPEGIDFLKLPWPDRHATGAFSKRYQFNGNFKYRPGTYIQSSAGCWWGKCQFCVERDRPLKVREPFDVYNEILHCRKIGFREVFDDSATLPTGAWLDTLLSYPKPGITIGCNMRMVPVDYKRMKDWGFRMLLFGVESANQYTLDRINKGVKAEDIRFVVEAAKDGLDCHVAVMFGYIWETDEEALKTLSLVHWLLRKGYAKTAQASFYRPPNGVNRPAHERFVRRIYDVAWYPDFWLTKLREVRSWADVKYLFRQIKEGLRR